MKTSPPAALTLVLPTLFTALLLSACAQTPPPASGSSAGPIPDFRVDPAWPLAEKDGVQQLFGRVAGIAVDPRNGNVRAIHRPATLLPDEFAPPDRRASTAPLFHLDAADAHFGHPVSMMDARQKFATVRLIGRLTARLIMWIIAP